MILKRNHLKKKLICRIPFVLLISMFLASGTGCSSLGLSIWPTQFPLLSETKQLASASSLPANLSNELSKVELPSYFLEPGDRILVEPHSLDSDMASFGDQKIQLDGCVDLGKFGRMRVVGLTVEQVEEQVEAKISESGQSDGINVQLIESNAAEVYVLGEVGSPAAYPIEGHEHVLDAILRAGGLTSRASPCDIVLVRPTTSANCRVVLPVCYRQITQIGDVSTNYQLQPGDRIVVGSRSFWEELSFWKLNGDCVRCSQSCGVECEPSNAQYQSRFTSSFPFFRKTPAVSQNADQSSRVTK